MSHPREIIIDDPLGDDSPPENYLEWWQAVFAGRLPAGGKIIVIEGRRHESDDPGITLSAGAGDWPPLVLPP